jgi:hypothetical protein
MIHIDFSNFPFKHFIYIEIPDTATFGYQSNENYSNSQKNQPNIIWTLQFISTSYNFIYKRPYHEYYLTY